MQRQEICGKLIKQIHDGLEKQVNNGLRAHDLTMVQGHVLLELFYAPEKQMTLKDLEKSLHVAQSTTAGIAVRLEQKGLVESFGDARDRRIKTIRITETGEQFCAFANQHMSATEEKLLSPLTEAERGTLIVLLQKICQALE